MTFYTALQILKTENFCNKEISFMKTRVHLPSFNAMYNAPYDHLFG